jgi:hypothetical protein
MNSTEDQSEVGFTSPKEELVLHNPYLDDDPPQLLSVI